MERSIHFPHLGLGFDYVPKSLQIFGFEITLYGILIAAGMMAAIAFVVLEAKRTNQNQDKYLDMAILSLAASVIGARLMYVIFSWDLYKGNPMEIFNIRSGGYVFYGGLLFGVLAAALFCRISKLDFWKMADTASMGILIGQIIGRWGDFFNRESFGEYTDSLFAMELPLTAVRPGEVTAVMRENLLTQGGVSFIRVQPVFLYESLWCLLLLLLLLAVRRRKSFEGELFMLYLAGYGLGRFFCEWLRTDKLLFPGTGIGISLIVSAALFLFVTPVLWVKGVMSRKRAVARKRRKEREYEAEEKAYREAYEEAHHTDVSEKELPGTETSGKDEEEKQEEQEKPVAQPAAETEAAGEMPQPEETENWENSEYAHISDTWRTAPPVENRPENRNSVENSAEETASSADSASAENP